MTYRDAKTRLDILGVAEEANDWLERFFDALIDKIILKINDLTGG